MMLIEKRTKEKVQENGKIGLMIMCSPSCQSDSERDLTPFAPNPWCLEALRGGNRSYVVKQIRKERKYRSERIERGVWTEVAYPVSHCRRETVKE